MSEQPFTGNSETGTTGPNLWGHLDSVPSMAFPNYATAQQQALLDRRPPHMDEARYRELMGGQLDAWEHVGRVMADGLAGEPISGVMGRLEEYADAVTQQNEAARGFLSLPAGLQSPTGRQSIRRLITDMGNQLALMQPDELRQIIRPEPEVAPSQSGPQPAPETPPFEHLADATAADAVMFADAGIKQFRDRQVSAGVSEDALRQLNGHELAPALAIRRRLESSANRDESLQTAMSDLAGFAENLASNQKLWQGQFANRQYRDSFIQEIQTLRRRIAAMPSATEIRRVAQAELSKPMPAAARTPHIPRPAPAPEQPVPVATPEPQPLPEPVAAPETPPQEETIPHRDAHEREARREFIKQLLDMSDQLEGSGVYTDVKGYGLRSLFAQKSLRDSALFTYGEPGGYVSPVKVWDEAAKDVGGADPTSLDEVLVEGVAFSPTYDTNNEETKHGSDKAVPKTVTMPDGSVEDVIRISYNFLPTWRGRAASDFLEKFGVDSRETNSGSAAAGRRGGHFAYAIEVPASQAETIYKMLEAGDISIMHEVGDELIQRHAPAKHKEAWNAVKAQEEEFLRKGDLAGAHFPHQVFPPSRLMPEGAPVHIFDGRGVHMTSTTQAVPYRHSVIRPGSRLPDLALAA